MAELLSKLLEAPSDPLPDFNKSSPPEPITTREWSLRHELPLYFINFLRDQVEPLLSLAQTTGATPGKANRPVKYEYNSPLKTVVESPGKPRSIKSENSKKPKKKVKLFPSKILGKANRSYSDIEEQLETGKNYFDTNSLDGISTLPTTPARNVTIGKSENRRKSVDGGYEVNYSDQGKLKRINSSFGGKTSDYETPLNNNRHSKKKLSPSPQAFSLADFITPIEGKKGNKKPKGSRSPSKVKSSTPIDENVAPRVQNLSLKLAELDLDNAESFPEIGDLGSKKRRMKPILIPAPRTGPGAVPDNPVFGQKVERTSFDNRSSDSPFKVEEVERKSVDSRQMVKEFASKLTPFKSTTANQTPVKPSSLSRSNSVVNQMEIASPLLVQHKATLDLLSDLYAYIFFHNLMPNIYVEIYFLMELLLLDVPVENQAVENEIERNYFSSLHNCVYFSCAVLGKCVSLFTYFDRTTLRLLLDNDRIGQFNQSLIEHLGDLYNQRSIPSPIVSSRGERSLRNQQNISFLTVSFQSETDNRSNFPSNASFHDFKKQRDKFYSLVRKWGEHNKGKEYSFENSLGGEVEKVMIMHHHPVNYYHFARLFVAQLVAMCRGEGLSENGDESQQLMAELKKTDPVKCKRLAARLVTPGRCGGPCPAPSFSGAAEFFRDFVLVCKNPQFVQHLKDFLVSEIKRLDTFQFDVVEGSKWGSGISRLEDSVGMEMSENRASEVLVEEFQETLITLRILAKFLGFLESFPYLHSGDDLGEELTESALKIREGNIPSLDISSSVTDAIAHGRLVLTLPWVIEFLTQLDQVAPSLSYYNSLLLKLAVLYQNNLTPLAPTCSPLNAYFLSLYLGWLFESKVFRRELLILAQISPPITLTTDDEHIDQQDVVSLGVVLQCCPWVGEVKTVLQQWEGGKKGSQVSLEKLEGTYRKITPLAAPLDRKDQIDKESMLQSQLEENFFHNQPKSLRRTVEYLAERLASNIIKKIRQEIVPLERTNAVELLKMSLPTFSESCDTVLAKITTKVPELSSSSLQKVKLITTSMLDTDLVPKCRSALDLLLASDTTFAAKTTCISIAERTVREKVFQWVNMHVTLAYFSREYQGEAERIARQASKEPVVLCNKSFKGKHDPKCPTPSELMISLKNDLKDLLLKRTELSITSEYILKMISECKKSISFRADLTPLAFKGFECLTYDWMLTLMAVRPQVVSDQVIENIVGLWTLLSPSNIINIVCVRNMYLFARSGYPESSWKKLKQLIIQLVETGLLPPIALEDSCLALFQLSRSEVVPQMEKLCQCLTDVASIMDRTDLEWINLLTVEFQNDLEIY